MLVKKRMLTVIAILGALTALLTGVVGIPSALSTRNLVTKIAEEQDKLDARYALRRYVRNSVANLAETKRRLGLLSDVAVHENKELDFITAVEKAATDAGVDQHITLETTGLKNTSAWERNIPVKFEVTGIYTDVLAFMNAVENLPYALNIDTVRINQSREGGGGDTGMVDADIEGVAYWQAQNVPDFVMGKADVMPVPSESGDAGGH